MAYDPQISNVICCVLYILQMMMMIFYKPQQKINKRDGRLRGTGQQN
jgi:hypothetical protein